MNHSNLNLPPLFAPQIFKKEQIDRVRDKLMQENVEEKLQVGSEILFRCKRKRDDTPLDEYLIEQAEDFEHVISTHKVKRMNEMAIEPSPDDEKKQKQIWENQGQDIFKSQDSKQVQPQKESEYFRPFQLMLVRVKYQIDDQPDQGVFGQIQEQVSGDYRKDARKQILNQLRLRNSQILDFKVKEGQLQLAANQDQSNVAKSKKTKQKLNNDSFNKHVFIDSSDEQKKIGDSDSEQEKEEFFELQQIYKQDYALDDHDLLQKEQQLQRVKISQTGIAMLKQVIEHNEQFDQIADNDENYKDSDHDSEDSNNQQWDYGSDSSEQRNKRRKRRNQSDSDEQFYENENLYEDNHFKEFHENVKKSMKKRAEEMEFEFSKDF